MTLVRASAIGLSDRWDYNLRQFRTSNHLGFDDFYAELQLQEILFDEDAPEPVLRLPYNSEPSEDMFSADQMRRCSYIKLTVTDSVGTDSEDFMYYVTSSAPSGSAPDRFWEFRCIRDWFSVYTRSFGGRWESTPEENDTRQTFAVATDCMIPKTEFPLPRFGEYQGTGNDLYIVKISTTERVTVEPGGNVTRREHTPTTYYTLVHPGYTDYVIISPSGVGYVTIDELLENIDHLATTSSGHTFGFTASAIVDVSISPRIPFTEEQLNEWRNTYMNIGQSTKYPAKRDGLVMVKGFDYKVGPAQELDIFIDKWMYYTGNLGLFTENNDRMADIPMQQMIPYNLDNRKMRLTVRTRAVSDMTGLYTELEIAGSKMMMPEGKIPYVGSKWEEYALAERTYDRENMTLAIQNAKSEAVQDGLMSVTNGVFAGALTGGGAGAAVGAVTAGLGIAGDIMSLERNERTARKQQDLKEKMIRNSVGTAYNTGYGLEYLRKSRDRTGRVQLFVPAHLTVPDFTQFVAWHGYPAGGLCSDQNSTTLGYLQGYITDERVPKYIRDRMNRELMEGVRFID